MKIVKPEWVGEYYESGFDKFNPTNIFAIDTETTGLDPWGTYKLDRDWYPARAFAISVCDEMGNMAYIRVPVNALTRRPDYSHQGPGWKLIKKILASKTISKVFHNYSFDHLMLMMCGMQVNGTVHDTMIRMHVIDSTEWSYQLKPLCKKYLGISEEDQQDLKKSVLSGRREAKRRGWATGTDIDTAADYWLGDPDYCQKYAEIDAYRTMALYLITEEVLEEDADLRELYRRECETMHTIQRMTVRGVRVDMDRSKEVLKYYEDIIHKNDKKIAKLAGKEFNSKSPKQMTKKFFGDLGHTPLKYSKKKRGAYVDCQHCKGEGCKICQGTGKNPKCDGEFLQTIGTKRDSEGRIVPADALAYSILERTAALTMCGYVKSYIDYAELQENGEWILHPNYKQTGTKTTRLSAQKPNMQNVASDESGKKKVDMQYRPRECFIARKGYKLLVPDFSQIEVWILALSSGDKGMLKQLAKGGDAHQIVADMAYPNAYDKKIAAKAEVLPPDKLTKTQKKHLSTKKTLRKRIKNLNFGIIYGMSDGSIGDMLGCSEREAKAFREDYYDKFPAVSKFMADTVKQVKSSGEAVSLYNRRYKISKHEAYIGTNYKVQGAAADLMKAGMVGVDNYCQEYAENDLNLLLQIHDELMIEVKEEIDDEFLQQELALAMSADWEMLGSPIPFPVGMKITESRWSDCREVG